MQCRIKETGVLKDVKKKIVNSYVLRARGAHANFESDVISSNH